MKRYRLSMVLIGLLIITSIFGMLSVNSLGVGDLDYTFENEIYYNDVITPSLFNSRNQTKIGGNYSATYTFGGETGETGTDISFVDVSTYTSAEVIDNFDGHNETLELETDGSAWKGIQNIFSSKTNGTIEFWIQFEILDGLAGRLLLRNTALDNVMILMWDDDGYLYEHDGTPAIICSYVIDTWYHIRIDFECGAGEYQGLSAYTFFVYVDGVKYGAYDFFINRIDITQFSMDTSSALAGNRYLDAIGYSWDNNYEIGLNQIHDYPKVNTLEADKWDLAYIDYTPRPIGDFMTGGGWSKHGFSDAITTIEDDINIRDKRVLINHTTTWYDTGIYRNLDEASSNSFYNISFKIDVDSFSNSDIETILYLYIDDCDSLDITLIEISREAITIFNYQTISRLDVYDINQIAGSFIINICFFDDLNLQYIYLNNTLLHAWYKPETNGVDSFIFRTDESNTGDKYQEWIIDYLGVYKDGNSLTTAKSIYGANLGGYLNLNRNNLISITMTGNLSVSINDFQVFNESNYDGTYFYNAINLDKIYAGGSITINATGEFTISNLYIRGAKLTDGVNDFYPTITSSNIENNESYFYVDNNNRFRWEMTVNDTDLEYLQASFNIPDIPSENRSVSFNSDINGQSKGYFCVNYGDDSSTCLEFPYYATSTSVILPQTQEIVKFTIVITDDDLDDNDLSTGYVSVICLRYDPDMTITLSTLSLLSIIVPLMILVAPPLAMKKNFGSSGVLLMFIAMAVVCVASNLIPIWLFFIIAISTIGFLFMKRKVEGEA